MPMIAIRLRGVLIIGAKDIADTESAPHYVRIGPNKASVHHAHLRACAERRVEGGGGDFAESCVTLVTPGGPGVRLQPDVGMLGPTNVRLFHPCRHWSSVAASARSKSRFALFYLT